MSERSDQHVEVSACLNFILNQVESRIERIEQQASISNFQEMREHEQTPDKVKLMPMRVNRLFLHSEIEQINETKSVEETSARNREISMREGNGT